MNLTASVYIDFILSGLFATFCINTTIHHYSSETTKSLIAKSHIDVNRGFLPQGMLTGWVG